MATMEEEVAEIRKRSPRAPAAPLKDSLDRALLLYDREGRHPVPLDVAAQDIGYKDYKGGAAKTALATLRQWGFIIRPTDGQVQVAKEVETYKFSPELIQRQSALVRWLKHPSVYNHLLSKYSDRLPSDAALKFDLIQLGFAPDAAAEQVQIFKESVEFSDYYAVLAAGRAPTVGSPDSELNSESTPPDPPGAYAPPASHGAPLSTTSRPSQDVPPSETDRIPIRLTGGRRAYLVIPAPFYEEDKTRIKAHIDLILTDETKQEGNGTE